MSSDSEVAEIIAEQYSLFVYSTYILLANADQTALQTIDGCRCYAVMRRSVSAAYLFRHTAPTQEHVLSQR